MEGSLRWLGAGARCCKEGLRVLRFGVFFNLDKRRQREDHSAVFTYETVSNKDRIRLCIAKEQEASTLKL